MQLKTFSLLNVNSIYVMRLYFREIELNSVLHTHIYFPTHIHSLCLCDCECLLQFTKGVAFLTGWTHFIMSWSSFSYLTKDYTDIIKETENQTRLWVRAREKRNEKKTNNLLVSILILSRRSYCSISLGKKVTQFVLFLFFKKL